MIALCIVLAVLVLILILPVGVDAAYIDSAFSLKAKAGPARIGILPKKERPDKPEKKKKPKEQKEAPEGKEHPKLKIGLADIKELLGFALKALGRFQRALSIDVFMLHMVSGAEDPYDAVMQFGYLNAGLSALSPLFHKVVKIRKEDIRTAVDLELKRPLIEARLAATLQIWEILYIGICAGCAFLRWFLRKKKEAKAAARAGAEPIEQKG